MGRRRPRSMGNGHGLIPAMLTRIKNSKGSRPQSRARGLCGLTPVREFMPWLLLLAMMISALPVGAQDSRELEQERAVSQKLTGEHPLTELMRTRQAALRPELLGVHPRVYVTDEEIAEVRARARTSHRELWARALSRVRALAAAPPPPPA